MHSDPKKNQARSRRGRLAPTLTVLLLLALLVPPGIEAQGVAISGLVADPGGGLPPPGTLVRLLNPDRTTFGQAQVDPGDGSFSLGGVPNGNYLLRAVPPVASGLTHSLPVPVSVLGLPVDVGTVALTWPSIVGSVFAPDGTTPAAAWVQVDSGGQWVQTTAAPTGEIRIGGLPGGSYVLRAWPSEDEPYWASEPLPVSVTPGISQTVSLTLTQAQVYGRAVDPNGTPVGEAVARVVDAAGQVVGRDLTSASGYFAIGGLPGGTYHLTLEPPWWQGGLMPPEPVPFAVPPPQNLGPVAFRASPKIVSGRVETNTGQPVLGARIEAHRLDRAGLVQGLSGASGLYSLSLSEGLWALTVKPVEGTSPSAWIYPYGPQLVHFQHDTSPEKKTVSFQVLTADSHVAGTVEMPGGGTPPFTVTVGIHTDAGIGRTQAIDPDDGSFDIPVPHGAYKVTVRAGDPGYLGPPVDPIRVLPNATHDLGTLSLLARNATVSGLVTGGGEPLGEVPVVAWRPDAPGGANTRTGPDGAFVLAVVTGRWLVKPAPEPEQPWLYAGAPVEVEVPDGGAVAGIDLNLVATDGAIAGRLVDESGAPVTDVEGWVQAVDVIDPAVQKGAPVEDGTFTVLVPAGTYRVSLQLPAGTPWLAAPASDVTASSGGTTEITLLLRAKDAAVVGALWDQRAEAAVSGVEAQVMAFSEGAWVRTAINPGNGAYGLAVASGIWSLGYTVDPAAAYVALRHRRYHPVASGQTVPAPLPVAEKDGLIAGVVRDPTGAPLAGAEVVADGLGAQLGDLHLRAVSGDDGRFHLRVPYGHYRVRATTSGTPGWINPISREVAVPEGGSVTGLDLQFVEPNAAIGGTVTLAGGGGEHSGPVKLWAYSPQDGYTKAEAELGGSYRLDAVAGTVWQVGAAYQDGPSYWFASERVVVPEGGATLDLALEGPWPLPAPVTVRFDAEEEQYLALADGTSIYIPAGAMPVSGTVTLHVTPIATFPHQRHANVYRYGYAFTAADGDGQPIEAQFDEAVLITFSYDETELARMGLSEQGLKPAYFSTTTDSWTFPDSYVVDTVADVVAMQIDHFTDFALTGAANYQVFLPLVVR